MATKIYLDLCAVFKVNTDVHITVNNLLLVCSLGYDSKVMAVPNLGFNYEQIAKEYFVTTPLSNN